MTTLEAVAVVQWSAFQTVEEAVDRTVSQIPSISVDALNALFCELKDRGALVSFSQLTVPPTPLQPPPTSKIEFLAIPTTGRTGCLERSMRSYLQGAREHDRKCAIFVGDDSLDSAASNGCRQMPASISPDWPGAIFYADVKAKQTFAELLSDAGRIPRGPIDYMLKGSEHSDRHPGANRNAILLHTLGSMALSVDDDTLCNVGTVPNYVGGTDISIGGHDHPEELWCFSDHAASRAFPVPDNLDVLAAHEALLGPGRSSTIPFCPTHRWIF